MPFVNLSAPRKSFITLTPGCPLSRLPPGPGRSSRPEGRRREVDLGRKRLRRGRQVLSAQVIARSYLPLLKLFQISRGKK